MRKLDFRNRRIIADLLDRVCVKDSDGFAVYKEGWSDDRVRAEVAPLCSMSIVPNHVSNLRRSEIGNLRKVVVAAAPKAGDDDLADEVLALSNTVEGIATRHNALAQQIAALQKITDKFGKRTRELENSIYNLKLCVEHINSWITRFDANYHVPPWRKPTSPTTAAEALKPWEDGEL